MLFFLKEKESKNNVLYKFYRFFGFVVIGFFCRFGSGSGGSGCGGRRGKSGIGFCRFGSVSFFRVWIVFVFIGVCNCGVFWDFFFFDVFIVLLFVVVVVLSFVFDVLVLRMLELRLFCVSFIWIFKGFGFFGFCVFVVFGFVLLFFCIVLLILEVIDFLFFGCCEVFCLILLGVVLLFFNLLDGIEDLDGIFWVLVLIVILRLGVDWVDVIEI